MDLGENIFVFGYPLIGILSSAGNFTGGMITALGGIADNETFIQISAPVQPGSSGGPVINDRGQTIGMIASKLTSVETENLNFAIRAEKIVRLMASVNLVPDLKSTRSLSLDTRDIASIGRQISVKVTCQLLAEGQITRTELAGVWAASEHRCRNAYMNSNDVDLKLPPDRAEIDAQGRFKTDVYECRVGAFSTAGKNHMVAPGSCALRNTKRSRSRLPIQAHLVEDKLSFFGPGVYSSRLYRCTN